MTISSIASRVAFLGNGVTTTWPFSFTVFGSSNSDQTNLELVFTDTLGNVTTVPTNQWSVTGITVQSGGPSTGGVITYPLVGSPIPVGSSLVIERIQPYEQLTSIGNQGAFYPQVIEGALDNLETQLQQINTNEEFSLQAPLSDQNPPGLLPSAASRANKFLAFDSSGNPIALAGNPSIIGTDLSSNTVTPVSTPRTLKNLFLDCVTPEDYGAVGNGIHDDTTACQSALNSGRDVFFAHQYFISTGLLPTNNQAMFGSGSQSKIIMSAADTNCVNVASVTNVDIHGINFVNTGTNTSGFTNCGIEIWGGSTYVNVSGCTFNCSGSGVTISGASFCKINDNVNLTTNAGSNWDFGIYLGGGKYNSICDNSCFANLSANGIALIAETADILYNLISNNLIYNKSQYGIVLYSHNASSPGLTQNNTVTGNVIDTITGTFPQGGTFPYGAGIYLQTADFTSVTGNVISRTNLSTSSFLLAPAAIGCGGTSVASIVGNTIQNPSQYGIMIASGDISSGGLGLGCVDVSANNITNPGNAGIFILGQSNVNVTGNVIFRSSAQGISVNGNLVQRTGLIISNNLITTCAAACLDIEYANTPTISGNKCIAGSFGLLAVNWLRGFVLGNQFESSTGATDVQFDNTNNGVIYVDRNITHSPGITNNFLDSALTPISWGQNIAGSATNAYAGTNALEPALANSATPSVNQSRMVQAPGPTAITDLQGGVAGQVVTIRATGNVTMKNNAGNPSTKLLNLSGADIALSAGQTITYELINGGPWIQVGGKAS